MIRVVSSRQFIAVVIAAVVLLITLWFVIPSLQAQIRRVFYTTTHYVVPAQLTEAERAIVEQDIRDIEEHIKNGTTVRSETVAEQYLQLGINFTKIGRNDLAIDAYTRAAVLEPLSAIPYANMGSVHEAATNYEAAKDAYRQAISKTPIEPSNYQKLAELYWYKFNEIAVARGVFIEGLIGTNQDLNLMRSYASFLEQTGYTSEALLYWQEILKKVPDDAAVRRRIQALTPPAPRK